jgi:hypothetical protein
LTTLMELWRKSRVPTKRDAQLDAHLDDPGTEKIVFWQDLSKIYSDMKNAGQIEHEMVARTVRMPSDRVWVEYSIVVPGRPHKLKQGLGLEVQENGIVRGVLCLGIENDSARAYCHISFPTGLPFTSDVLNFVCHAEEVREEIVQGAVMECLFGLFLLQQPKVYSDQMYEPSPKLQKRRAKEGGAPLPKYRAVTLRLGAVPRRSAGAEQGSGGTLNGQGRKHRYHHVLGHFRMYERDTPTPRVVWIEPHYRGDPELGIVGRERRVTVKPQED